MMAKRTKYNNVKCTYGDLKFDSKGERDRWVQLLQLERVGEIRMLHRQVSFPIEVEGVKICKYVADYVYTAPNGEEIVEDFKGKETPEFRLKKKLMKACYGIDILVTRAS